MFKILDFLKSTNGHSDNKCPSCMGYVGDDEVECSHCGIAVNQKKDAPEFNNKIRQALNIRKSA